MSFSDNLKKQVLFCTNGKTERSGAVYKICRKKENLTGLSCSMNAAAIISLCRLQIPGHNPYRYKRPLPFSRIVLGHTSFNSDLNMTFVLNGMLPDDMTVPLSISLPHIGHYIIRYLQCLISGFQCTSSHSLQ